MYYILRKLFIKLDFSKENIVLEKGIFLKRTGVLPLSSVVRISSERGLLLRIFRAKKITVYTLNGKLSFYLPKDEALPFLPENKGIALKPRFPELAFGAFIDTRALAGIAFFSAILHRISRIFGSDYFNGIISAIFETAENISKALSILHIFVPKIAAVLAVFTIGAWITAFSRKLLKLARFRVSRRGDILTVTSGIVTLYESTLVLNSSAAVSCDTVFTMICKRAPIFCRGVMIYPAADRKNHRRLLKTLCKMNPDISIEIASPKSAFFGHCAAPLGRFAGFSAALILAYSSESFRSAELLKTVLYGGAFINLYTAAVYVLYMSRSGAAFGENTASVASRRGARLYTAVLPTNIIVREKLSQSIFQRRSGLCNFQISTVEHRKFKARQLSKSEILKRRPF